MSASGRKGGWSPPPPSPPPRRRGVGRVRCSLGRARSAGDIWVVPSFFPGLCGVRRAAPPLFRFSICGFLFGDDRDGGKEFIQRGERAQLGKKREREKRGRPKDYSVFNNPIDH